MKFKTSPPQKKRLFLYAIIWYNISKSTIDPGGVIDLNQETLAAVAAAVAAAKKGEEYNTAVTDTTAEGETEVRFVSQGGGVAQVEISAPTGVSPLKVAIQEAVRQHGGTITGGSKGGLFSTDFTFTV